MIGKSGPDHKGPNNSGIDVRYPVGVLKDFVFTMPRADCKGLNS
jgi:hypothetical protein